MINVPSAEVVTVGNELLTGLTLNSNAAFINKTMTALGFQIQRQTTLPDDIELLKEGLAEAMSCSSLVIVTGGLGPTLDDVTKEAASELFDSKLQYDETFASELLSRYGDKIMATLQKQATIPVKALRLPNPLGTAPGFIFHEGTRTLILLPGVPLEMQELFNTEVLPFLKKHFLKGEQFYSELLHFGNTFEAEVDPILRQMKEEEASLEFGIYPSQSILTVQIKSAEKLKVTWAAQLLQKKFPHKLFSSPSGKIEEAIHNLFISQALTLSLAESCTGGLISSRLTQLPGASNYFQGSLIAYSNELKTKLLQVNSSLIQEKGAVSPEVASAMAEGIMALCGTSYSAAITGVAGPTGGTLEKPVGTVFYAIKEKGHPPIVRSLHALGSRAQIIERSANILLATLYELIKKTYE